MSYLTHLGGGAFQWILQTTWQAAVLAGLILLAQRLLRKRLPPSWRYGLWLLLVVRLLMPVAPQSTLSVFNLARSAPTRPGAVNQTSSVSVAGPYAIVNSFNGTPSLDVPAAPEPRFDPALIPPRVVVHSAWNLDWFGLALCGWLAGVCFFGARLVWTNGRFRARLGGYQPVTEENVTRLFDDCRAAFKITQAVRLIESDEVESPAVYGLWRKWLLLPDGVFERFSTQELRCIFLHELAHIKRGDLGVNWLVAVLQVLHWFNPILWLAWARMRVDRELATDALALAHVREADHAPYGETILKVLEGLTGERALPGLVGIVENKEQLKERLTAISRPGKHWKWAALAAAALIAGLGLTGAQTEKSGGASEPPRPDLTGHLQLTNGQPVQATVFLWTAGPKVGTSPFCPGCYADCRKSAKTDAKGTFKIESLDPQLIFRVLVVGEGLRPKFVEKVDAAKGSLSVSLEPQNLSGVPAEMTLRARIVDARGVPIEAAAIQPRGFKSRDGGEKWGVIKEVDPLAISDAQGRFVLTANKPFDTLGIWVEARGFAPKAFKELAGGSQTRELVMTEGASLKGRVLRDGQPVANISVSTTSVERRRGEYPGNFEVGTDAEGRFVFVNMPPQVHYDVCGRASTLETYGSTPVTEAATGADGSTTDMGDLNLSVKPAHRISGRVVLSDGQPLPPKTRLVAASRESSDSKIIELDKDGHFDTAGIPPGKVVLRVQVPGYRLSMKNASLDQLNPGGLVGRVDHDITNLVVLMEKGPRLRSHFDSQADDGPEPENSPLQGAENAGDHSRQREISGRLTDAQTGEPIARFRVTPGRWNNSMSDLDWNPNLSVEGSNGNYVIDIDKRGGAVELKFEAEGYLPAAAPRVAADSDHCDFSLAKGSGPSGTVFLPDGQPAAGVKVLLTYPHSPGVPALGLIRGGSFQTARDEDTLVATDASGHFSLAPKFGMKAVVVSGSAGFKMVPVESFKTNVNITLEPWGNIKGVLHRPSGPGTNQSLAVTFAAAADSRDLMVFITTKTDDKGAFAFDHVPPGEWEIQTVVAMGEDAADTEELKRVHVAPGQTAEVTIEAPAKAKPIMLGRRFGGEDILPPVKSSLRGTVVLPDGKPAANAQVGVKLPSQNLQVGDGELVGGALDDGLVRTEADGSFNVPVRDTATALYAASEAGFAKVPSASWTNGVKIILQPWGRVEGVLRLNHRPAGNEKVELREDRDLVSVFQEGGFRSTAATDDQGRFVFARVPAGDLQLCRSIPFGNNGWTLGDPLYLSVRSGETTNLTFGGNRRPVVGKFVVENIKDLPEDPIFMVNLYSDKPYPAPPDAAGRTNLFVSERKMAAWRKTPAGRKAVQDYHSFEATAAADGSFQIDDVTPGTYELSLAVHGNLDRLQDMRVFNSPQKRIVVPSLSDPEKCEPFDLGVHKTTVALRRTGPFGDTAASKLKQGDAAPAFETKTLSGGPLKLSDYRGKYILLDFRFMLPALETETIEAVNESFGKDDRFVIISLCQNTDEDYVKRLSSKGATHWVQGNLDFNTMGDAYGLNGASFPMILLIDPNGNIVATGLRGEAIQSTVATALAKK
jgi:beta-lactamase regulating signal transducer with metallopeptidase domain